MTPPDVAYFKATFVRDFPYASTTIDYEKVMDSDITAAISAAAFNINESLFDTEANYQLAYSYLAAHYIVVNLKNSGQGLNGNFNWLENSKSVGSVSQSFSIPEDILKNPMYAMLSKTSYGARYISMILPKLYGNMGIVAGWTQP
jgi:hypothetical protein